jgi:ankyrin repeat protein
MMSRPDKRLLIACLAVLSVALSSSPAAAAGHPVIEAAKAGNVARLTEILKSDPSAVTQTDHGLSATPLHWAVINGHREAAFFLIARGAPIKARDKAGFTVLHYAAYAGLPVVASALIDRGADVNAVSDWIGATPLHLAALKNRIMVAAVLLDRGAKASRPDKRGRTPRQYALSRGYWLFAAMLSQAE